MAFQEKMASIPSIIVEGQVYNYYRDYDPRLGRYLQSDPIALWGSFNIYNYANNNSLTSVDVKSLNAIVKNGGGGPVSVFIKGCKLVDVGLETGNEYFQQQIDSVWDLWDYNFNMMVQAKNKAMDNFELMGCMRSIRECQKDVTDKFNDDKKKLDDWKDEALDSEDGFGRIPPLPEIECPDEIFERMML